MLCMSNVQFMPYMEWHAASLLAIKIKWPQFQVLNKQARIYGNS